jgi:hypothetical protein
MCFECDLGGLGDIFFSEEFLKCDRVTENSAPLRSVFRKSGMIW